MLDDSAKRRFDWLMFLTACAIIAIGVLFIWSAKPQGFAKRQLIWAGAGMAIFFTLLRVSYLHIAQFSYVLYGLGVAVLVFVLVPGNPLAKPINNVQRWVTLGPVRVQPSEFAKLAVVLALARYLMYRKNYRTLPGLIGPFALVMIPLVLVLREPDLGTALVFLPVLFVLLFVAGAKLSHLLTIVGLGLAACPLLYLYVMEPYQQDRLRAFINPSRHSAGSAYQLVQSLIAIGSGGFLGKGWSRGTQNLLDRVPEPHTDFIFSVIGEEAGFAGSALVLLLYFVLLLCGIGTARRTREPCGRLIAMGVVTVFAVQVVVNVGMTMGIAPVTGMTLPLISYGGSSLVASLIALSLVMNVAMRRTPVLAAEDFEFHDEKT